MDNSEIYAIITYLIIFRVSIILVGGISIFLGYRLFVQGIISSGAGDQGASLDAKLAGHEISLRNAAPGTFFALFGVTVISVMLLSSPPEIHLERLERLEQDNVPSTEAEQDGESSGVNETTATVRSSRLIARGEKPAETWNTAAWDDLDRSLDAAKRAIKLARDAEANGNPDENFDEYLDTLAAMSFIGEQDEDARAKALDQAPADSDFRRKLEQFCEMSGG